MKQHRKMLRNGWFSHDGGGGRAVGTPHHEPLVLTRMITAPHPPLQNPHPYLIYIIRARGR